MSLGNGGWRGRRRVELFNLSLGIDSITYISRLGRTQRDLAERWIDVTNLVSRAESNRKRRRGH